MLWLKLCHIICLYQGELDQNAIFKQSSQVLAARNHFFVRYFLNEQNTPLDTPKAKWGLYRARTSPWPCFRVIRHLRLFGILVSTATYTSLELVKYPRRVIYNFSNQDTSKNERGTNSLRPQDNRHKLDFPDITGMYSSPNIRKRQASALF